MLAGLWLVGRGGLWQDCAMSRTRKIMTMLALCLGLAAPVQAGADAVGALREGLTAAQAKDWTAALTAARGAGAVGGDIILWHWLRAGEGRLGQPALALVERAVADDQALTEEPGGALQGGALLELARLVDQELLDPLGVGDHAARGVAGGVVDDVADGGDLGEQTQGIAEHAEEVVAGERKFFGRRGHGGRCEAAHAR